jgi:hypothetical protein
LDDRRFLFSIKSLPSTTPPVVNIPLTPTLSPVSGGEGVIPSPAWAGEGKGEGGKVSQDFCNS